MTTKKLPRKLLRAEKLYSALEIKALKEYHNGEWVYLTVNLESRLAPLSNRGWDLYFYDPRAAFGQALPKHKMRILREVLEARHNA